MVNSKIDYFKQNGIRIDKFLIGIEVSYKRLNPQINWSIWCGIDQIELG